MAAAATEESIVGRSSEGITSANRSQSGEALAEWRSSVQVENGTPSTSPPYWDTDDDDDGGPKPSDLYGKYTWRIEKFSQLNKRELRSNAFEVGGYKWYILIYPQGCDVCNHLSLFLCVANHDKLLPGWSHFSQFTIAVVNKDPKKSKYSDTLHRFWKKEHDWGWKKFMELSKVLDGFIDADTLIIKAQVQVIRERADRPFHCLDCQYRRELVRVYLTNVEQICRRFVEERRTKLEKLIEDKARWSSFCAFWLGIDQNARRRMSREKTDSILKVVVKHFFIEKEVTSTLVMDSLYSGLKALESQSKCKKGGASLSDAEELPAPIVRVEKDTFVLVDDVLLLLERAAMEPLPPKDEKGPQIRTKDGNSGEDFNKDSIERDERRLTELGRKTVEVFVLAHIFSNKVEVAYQEAVALKRQEELIREEEAAWQAESGQKARRGTMEKEKKSKKKQAKQKGNNRKRLGKGREERVSITGEDKQEQESSSNEKKNSLSKEVQTVIGKPDVLEDLSDVSDSAHGVGEVLQPDSEDRDASPVSWDIDTSEIYPPIDASSTGISSLSSTQTGLSDKKSPSIMDDSSSTCSTDSVPSLVMNRPYKGSSSNYNSQKLRNRGKNQRGDAAREDNSWTNETESQLLGPASDAGDQSDVSGSSKPGESESDTVVFSHQDRIKWLEQHVVKKEEEVVSLQEKQSTTKNQIGKNSSPKGKTSVVLSSPRGSPHKNLTLTVQQKSDHQTSANMDTGTAKKTSLSGRHETKKSPQVGASFQILSASKAGTPKPVTPKPAEKATTEQVPEISRPSSAPLIPVPGPNTPAFSMVPATSLHARSVSTAGRLGPDPSPVTHSYAPQSYRNAMMGNHVSPSNTNFTHPSSPSSKANPYPAYSQAPTLASAPIFIPHNSGRLDLNNTVKSSFPFGTVARDILQDGPSWIEGSPQREAPRSMHYNSPLFKNVQNLDLSTLPVYSGAGEQLLTNSEACTSGLQTQGLGDEFPHLDIINDLLDDEHVIGNAARASSVLQSLSNGQTPLNRQFSLPENMAMMSGEMGSSSSSCRFERTRSFHDGGFQQGYNNSSSAGIFEPAMDFIPLGNSLSYVNGGQVDGLIHNQWQMGSDLSYLGMGSSECDGYQFMNPDYLNMACGINGYNVFMPSNGH